MNIEKKFLNLNVFNGMSREDILAFAQTRGITVSAKDAPIEDLKLDVAQKDAQRFANKGLRMQEQPKISLSSLLERIEAIEKHLGIGK